MATANDILRIAANEIGYSRWNDPLNGSKYGRWYAEVSGSSYYGSNGVPYCAMFVSWVFNQAGQDLPGLPTAGCGDIRNANRNTSSHINRRDARPGDVVLFRWDGNVNDFSYSDHVGIVELNRGSYIQTIEGNTSSGTSGSQSNGGGVYRRTRSWENVQMIIRPVYIERKALSESDVNDISAQAYTGSEVKPALTSSTGATFTSSYEDNVNVGYGTAIATGTGSYTGSVRKQFAILPPELLRFTDVKPTDWYVSSLAEAVKRGYISGYSDGTRIGPNDAITRGQACCVIANAADADIDSEFSDVVASPYYYESVDWAADNDIVNGINGEFKPDRPCTREEFCVMLCNWKGSPMDISQESFSDWNEVSDWAKPSVSWCVEDGIIFGNDGKLRPKDACTRAEAASMLVSLMD